MIVGAPLGMSGLSPEAEPVTRGIEESELAMAKVFSVSAPSSQN